MEIKVKELIAQLQECDPEAFLTCSIDVGDEKDATKRIFGYGCIGVNDKHDRAFINILFNEAEANYDTSVVPGIPLIPGVEVMPDISVTSDIEELAKKMADVMALSQRVSEAMTPVLREMFEGIKSASKSLAEAANTRGMEKFDPGILSIFSEGGTGDHLAKNG